MDEEEIETKIERADSVEENIQLAIVTYTVDHACPQMQTQMVLLRIFPRNQQARPQKKVR